MQFWETVPDSPGPGLFLQHIQQQQQQDNHIFSPLFSNPQGALMHARAHHAGELLPNVLTHADARSPPHAILSRYTCTEGNWCSCRNSHFTPHAQALSP